MEKTTPNYEEVDMKLSTKSSKKNIFQKEKQMIEYLELYKEKPRNAVKDFRSLLEEHLQKIFDQREEELEFQCLEAIEKLGEQEMPYEAWEKVIKLCSAYLK